MLPHASDSSRSFSSRVDQVSAGAEALRHTRWLIATDDPAWGDGVAKLLRAYGGRVCLMDAAGQGLSRLSSLDVQILLVTESPSAALRRAVDAHAGVRWASTVIAGPEQLWPAEQLSPDLDTLLQLAAPALEADHALVARAQAQQHQFSVVLESLGPVRLLRALCAVPDVFVVQWTHRQLRGHVALAHGLWLGASCESMGGRAPRLEGLPALARLLELRDAGCLVLRGGRIKARPEAQPLGAAIETALGIGALQRSVVPSPSSDREAAERAERSSRGMPLRDALAGVASASWGSLRGLSTALAAVPRLSAPFLARAAGFRRGPRVRLRGAIAVVLSAVVFGVLALHEWGSADSGESVPAASVTLTAAPRSAAVPAVPTPQVAHVEPLQSPEEEGGSAAEPVAAAPPRGEDELAPGAWLRSRRLTRQARRTQDRLEARRLWEQALQADPHNPHALAALSRAHRRDGDLAVAQALAERAVRLRPQRSKYRLLLGELYLHAHQPEKARGAYQAALRLRPRSRAAQLGVRRAERALRHAASE